MRKSGILYFAHHFVGYYPFAIALIFIGTLYRLDLPYKGAFTGRALLALVIATFLAHVNRIWSIVPEHLLFPSGHTTFCSGIAFSLAMLRPLTLYYTVPCTILMACLLVGLGYHEVIDIIGAIPLVIAIYGPIHYFWRLPSDSLLLDRARVSA